jgi:hypothetical protein
MSTKDFLNTITPLFKHDTPLTIEPIGQNVDIYMNIFPLIANIHINYKGKNEFQQPISCQETDILFLDNDATLQDALCKPEYIVTYNNNKFAIQSNKQQYTLNDVANDFQTHQFIFF